jgi:dolichol kinase
MNLNTSFLNELKRKIIHLGFLWIPILYSVSSKKDMLLILVPLTFVSLLVERYRFFVPAFKTIFEKIFIDILREHEKSYKKFTLTGASYLLIAATVTIAFFEKNIALIAITVAIVSDGAAALAGKYFHKKNEKTRAGFLGFFVSGIVVSSLICWGNDLLFQLFYLYVVFAVALASFLELYSAKLKIDDNILISLSIGFIITLLQIITN